MRHLLNPQSKYRTVEGTYQLEYWMHLYVPSDVKLKKLDDFLRETWVECCGHLSAFIINNIHYEQETGGMDNMWFDIFDRGALQKYFCKLL